MLGEWTLREGKTFGEGTLKGESNTLHIWGSIDRRRRKLQQKIWKLLSDHLVFLRQPFSVSTDGRWPAGAKKASIVEAYVQMGISEMATSDLLEDHHILWVNPQDVPLHAHVQVIVLFSRFPQDLGRKNMRLESASGLLQQNTGQWLMHPERYVIRRLFSFQNITWGKTLGLFLHLFVLFFGKELGVSGWVVDFQCGRWGLY